MKRLKNRISPFSYLNITQFLGALNDNTYKLLLVYFLIQLQGIENSPKILSISGAIFVLPFMLFSPISGTLADRYSKRNIIIGTKLLEFVIMAGAVWAFFDHSQLGSYFILFLLSTQSALFGPSKYGILPELVESEKISKANGMMSLFTFLAIIIGTFLASFLIDISDRNFILAAVFCTLLSLVGLAASFCIPYTPPSGSSKKVKLQIFKGIYASLQIARLQPSLLAAIFGSTFFLFIGAFVQLNMIPFATQTLNLTDVQGGYLFLITALGIGTGSFIAGRISGKSVELALVPIACLMITFCLFLVDSFSNKLFTVLPIIFFLGFFGGVYQVPLDAFIQISSPNKSRGQIVAATNFLCFFGVLCASALVYLLYETFSFKPDKAFSMVGSFSLVITGVLSFQFFDYVTRFIGMILSKLHFKTVCSGTECIPRETPAIYLCTHTAWNDTLLLLGAQRRRIRFFIEKEQDHSKWLKRLYQLLRYYLVPATEILESNAACKDTIKRTLKKGISVCIFTESENICHEVDRFQQSDFFKEIFEETGCPMIPVIIEKGVKAKQKIQIMNKVLHKIRVPAAISFGEEICQI